jgi:DNA ligase (NAD+)
LDFDVHIGDTVIIQRCGEIIPDVIKVIPGAERVPIEVSECPVCGAELNYIEPHFVCINNDCPGKLSRRITDSVKRLKIDNISTSTIERLIDMNLIETAADLFDLTYDDVLLIPRFAEKSAKNLINELKRVKNQPIEDFRILAALNLIGIGENISRVIFKHYTFDELLELDVNSIQQIPQMGFERAFILYDGLQYNEKLINKYRQIFNIVTTKGAVKKGTICITGKVSNGKEYWHNIAEKNGYATSGTISKDITYLISDDAKSNSTKIQKAEKLGIQIITTKQFESIIKS